VSCLRRWFALDAHVP